MLEIITIALALALDASGVAIALGCGSKMQLKQKAYLVFSFGFFQFLLALLGALIASYINNNLFTISGVISGIIILIIGLLFIKEGFQKKDECILIKLGFWTYLVMGVSVSIDALGVGFSVLYNTDIHTIIYNSIVIGIIAALATAISLKIVNFIRNFSIVESYADYLGGIILVIFGIDMIIG